MRIGFSLSVKFVSLMLFLTCFFSQSAQAEIIVFDCSAPNVPKLVFTFYSDGTPARVGVSTGVGNKALVWQDRFGAWVFIETNTDGSPVTMSTIQKNLDLIHSRQKLTIDGSVLEPSQSKGSCKIVRP